MKYYKTIAVGLTLLFLFIPVASGQTVQEHLQKAQSSYQAKEYDQAIFHYKKVVEFLKKNNNLPVAQKVKINLANIYMIQGKNDLALEELEAAKALYKKPEAKTKINLYSKLAAANYNLKQYASAVQILEELLDSGVALTPPQKANLQANLADAYQRSELHSKAIQAYKEVLKYYELEKNTQKQQLILNALGSSYHKLGDFQNAIKYKRSSAHGRSQQ